MMVANIFQHLWVLLVLSRPILPEADEGGPYFRRIASFPICLQIDSICNTSTATSAEIVDVSADGNTLIYTDGQMGALGWIDITDPFNPQPMGFVVLSGSPTSTANVGDFQLVVLSTGENYTNPSGMLQVYSVASMEMVAEFPLSGQPDSVTVSPDKTVAAIVIENERDEDLGDGGLPQSPPGLIVIVDVTNSDPTQWSLTEVGIAGLDGSFVPEDPEPEYVAFNSNNMLGVTLQENNAIVLIDAISARVVGSFTAGNTTISHVDATEDGVILMDETLTDVPREPDAIVWLSNDVFATADEGDWIGGGRGFTIYDVTGQILYSSGSLLDQLAARIGQYPEGRSESAGSEPETVEYAMYGQDPILIVSSERSGVLFVFNAKNQSSPDFVQMLPAGYRPEGVKAVPARDLLVAASEEDERESGYRAQISIYKRGYATPSYPLIMSSDRSDGTPIPFAALSGLAATRCSPGRTYRHLRTDGIPGSKCNENIMYTIEDSFFNKNRVLAIDTSKRPPTIVKEMRISDADGVFATALTSGGLADAIASLINDDKTVNIDPEGIAVSEFGGFWLVHEGAGTAPDIETPNLLFRLDANAVIRDVILLPDAVNEIQDRYGFEGVAEDGQYVVVVFQREWTGEDYPRVGIWDTMSKTWSFLFYPLDTPESPNGGWVGLSDVAPIGNGKFLVLERDNQSGLDAAIKRIYLVDINEADAEMSLLKKTLVMDLLETLIKATNGQVVEKVEGLTVDTKGNVWINNDNDGVDDNSGENLLLNLGNFNSTRRPDCYIV